MTSTQRGAPKNNRLRKGKLAQTLGIAALSLGLALGTPPAVSQAAGDVEVYVSFEGYNLSQGYYVQPVKVGLPEGGKASEAVMKVLEDAGRSAKCGSGAGTACQAPYGTSGFYLNAVDFPGAERADLDLGDWPDYLAAKIADTLGELDGVNGDGYLGQDDYLEDFSGWMFTVNNSYVSASLGSATLNDGDVVRVQFVLWMGQDLGVAVPGVGTPFFTMADKSQLIRELANADPQLATDAEQDDARAVAIDPKATTAQVAAAIEALTTGPAAPPALPAGTEVNAVKILGRDATV
ncbi:MAG: DUF4430 domain-containing protein, partial [Propionibacteriaceae bacterium]|nr:DUF4430 domain-containing protein [Propionibacteriaceae bacterium]